ncbi:MAG: alpha/beta fold hydrolase [Acidobacteria bacterium]|nr:alpha/beta fold hydrolase [Acidobacteriota bacterium]
MGKYLARNGIDSYIVELPGHGQSPLRYEVEACYENSRAALEEIIRLFSLHRGSISLVGHSFGAMIIARIGLLDTRFRCSVLVGPGFEANLGTTAPRNALFVTAERDYSLVRESVRRMILSASAGRIDREGELIGSFEAGNARQWWVAPGVAHVSLIYNGDVYCRIREWIARSMLRPDLLPEGSVKYSSLGVALGLAGASVVLISIVVLWLASSVFPQAPGPVLFVSTKPAFELLVLLAGWLVSLNVLRFFVPLRFLRLEEGEVIASVFFLSGFLSTAAWFAFRCKFEAKHLRRALRPILVAVVSVSFHYLAALTVVSRDLYQLTLTLDRAWRSGVIALASLPLFLVTEAVVRGFQRVHGKHPLRYLLALLVGVTFLAVVFLSSIVQDVRLIRFFPFFFVFVVAVETYSCILYEFGKTPFLTATFQCLMFAWIMGAGFAIR